MKKLLLSLMAIGCLLGANAQTKDNPYTVKEFIKAGATGQAGVYVKGFILGHVDPNSSKEFKESLVFEKGGKVYSNIILGDAVTETDAEYIIPVQLPSASTSAEGAAVRAALNLGDHPENFQHEVIICGTADTYFKVVGLKLPTSYEWVGEAPVPETPSLATGSKEKPLTVAEFLEQGTPSSAVANTYVSGVIVGYVPGMTLSEAVFGDVSGEVNAANLLLAASADVKDYTLCIPVQLPSQSTGGADGAAVRAALNLKDNPGNLGKTVTICGSHEKYFGANGLKLPTWCELDGKSTGTEGGGTTTDPSTPTTPSIYAGLEKNADDWTFDQGTLPEGLSYVWAWDDKYGIKASAYVGGTRYVTDAWAISPVIDLTDYKDVKVAAQQAINFGGGKTAELCLCKVREADGAWETLEYTNMPEGTSWTFNDTEADLAKFQGKKVQLAYEYTSTTTDAPTWEIKNVKVTGVSVSGVEEIILGQEVYVEGNNIVAPAGARVFNLSGVEAGTQNLPAGVYVVVLGNKAVKLLVK